MELQWRWEAGYLRKGIYSMQILIGILILIICIMAIYIWKYQRQVQDICRQMSFLNEHDSNMLITQELNNKSIRNLVQVLNEFLHLKRKERKAHLKKEKNISDIYTNISHDIRTPLTSLDGYFQLLEKSENAEEQARYISIIQQRIASLKDMLEELFEYTKLENDSYELELTNCCVNRILKDTVFSYYEEWQRRGIEAEFQITEELLYIEGNEQALRRVIQNVIKNGLDHGEKRIRIVLEKRQEKILFSGKVSENSESVREQIVLEISNRVGHPEQIDVERVFERFYKAEKSRSKNSTGLGLAIAKELVQRMGGRIEAKLTSLDSDDAFGIEIYFSGLSV